MSDVTIGIDVDATDANFKLDALQVVINQRKAEVDKVVREGMRELRKLQRAAGLTFGLLTGLVRAYGGTIPPLMQAAIQAVDMTFASIATIAQAYLLIPGYGWMIFAAISAFTLGFGLAARLDMSQKSAAVNARIDGVLQSLNSLAGMVGLAGSGGRI